jgi:acetyl esterase
MTLDPILARLLESVPVDLELPIDWPALRASVAILQPMIVGATPRIEVAAVEDREIEGPEAPVKVRIYRPTKPTGITLHYIHGGGWTIGDLDMVDHVIRYLCDALPAVVVSSTYRLAPEHPFPAAYEDAFAAAQWVVEHAGELGGDPALLAIAGDSAGGNLAASVAIGLRDMAKGESHPFKTQLLLYPAVDLREEAWELPSRVADADPGLRCAAMRATCEAYIGDHDPGDWRMSPSRASLADLPAALIVVLTVDPLRDEAAAYADRLKCEGVPTELIEFSNLTHGFANWWGIVPAAAAALDDVLRRFREMHCAP